LAGPAPYRSGRHLGTISESFELPLIIHPGNTFGDVYWQP
jgi:hypothetical protein